MSTSIPPNDAVPVPVLRQTLAAIKRADVLYLTFPRLLMALLVDFRAGAVDRPAVLLAPYAVSQTQQIAAIEHLRPGFAAIGRLAGVPWGGSTRAFAEQGVLPAILDRLPPDLTQGAMAAFQRLRDAERGTASTAEPPDAVADEERP